MIKLKRYAKNPILSPNENWWESKLVFNPGVAEYQGKIILLYRAVGMDGVSRFGLAESKDGIRITKRLSHPVLEGELENPYERLGIEDPRIVKFEDTYYITYTATSLYAWDKKLNWTKRNEAPWRIRASLVSTKDFKNFYHHGMLFPHEDQKDVILFSEKIKGQYWLFNRLYPDLWLTHSGELTTFKRGHRLLFPQPNSWEEERVGGGAPPIKTKVGWLVFYHAADRKYVYRLGAMLLDLTNPKKIIAKLDYPILEPIKKYETMGPIVPNVCFTCGAIEKNGQYLVYYGAADTFVAVATINKNELLAELIKAKK